MLALHLKLFSVNCFITHDLFNDPLVYANWQSFSTAVDIIIQFSHLWRFTRHFCFVVRSFHHRFRGEALPAFITVATWSRDAGPQNTNKN